MMKNIMNLQWKNPVRLQQNTNDEKRYKRTYDTTPPDDANMSPTNVISILAVERKVSDISDFAAN